MEYIRDISRIEIESDKCIGCGICIDVCPHDVICINEEIAFLSNKNRCMECGACDKNCPTNAIQVEVGTGCAYAVINSWFSSRKKGKNIV